MNDDIDFENVEIEYLSLEHDEMMEVNSMYRKLINEGFSEEEAKSGL